MLPVPKFPKFLIVPTLAGKFRVALQVSKPVIHNELQKGVFFSNYHKKEIGEANKILAELNTLISMLNNFEEVK